jgi:hypothetical protein
MNAGMSLVAIVSLLVALAMAGGAAGGNSTTTASDASRNQPNATKVGGCGRWGCGQNHNETPVRDTALTKGGSQTCPKWVCGANHNESMARDTAPMK